MLSPGEMQRLSFVRLFFNQPPFACKCLEFALSFAVNHLVVAVISR